MRTTRWIGAATLIVWGLGWPGAAIGAEMKPAHADAKEVKDVKEVKVNINGASKAELMKLDGVGASAAQKIIAYREAHGPFKRPQDLSKVDGIGKAVLEKNMGRITVK